jgi:hypothetical protein
VRMAFDSVKKELFWRWAWSVFRFRLLKDNLAGLGGANGWVVVQLE